MEKRVANRANRVKSGVASHQSKNGSTSKVIYKVSILTLRQFLANLRSSDSVRTNEEGKCMILDPILWPDLHSFWSSGSTLLRPIDHFKAPQPHQIKSLSVSILTKFFLLLNFRYLRIQEPREAPQNPNRFLLTMEMQHLRTASRPNRAKRRASAPTLTMEPLHLPTNSKCNLTVRRRPQPTRVSTQTPLVSQQLTTKTIIATITTNTTHRRPTKLVAPKAIHLSLLRWRRLCLRTWSSQLSGTRAKMVNQLSQCRQIRQIRSFFRGFEALKLRKIVRLPILRLLILGIRQVTLVLRALLQEAWVKT